MHECNCTNKLVRYLASLPFLTVLLTGVTVGLDPREARSQETVYVANRGSSTVVAIDPATNTVIGLPITIPGSLSEVTASPDGSRVYVVNSSIAAKFVAVIETATNTVTETIGVGFQPIDMVVSPDGKRGYVNTWGEREVGATSG